MQKRNWVRLSGVTAKQNNRTRILNVVHAVGHRTVAPGVSNTRNRGRVTDTRLVISIISSPESVELTEQISLFVVILCGTKPVDRIRSRFFPYF